jgi:hypothetical protein
VTKSKRRKRSIVLDQNQQFARRQNHLRRIFFLGQAFVAQVASPVFPRETAGPQRAPPCACWGARPEAVPVHL